MIMVGLPFANMGSIELKERMKYVGGLPNAGKNAGLELYEVSVIDRGLSSLLIRCHHSRIYA